MESSPAEFLEQSIEDISYEYEQESSIFLLPLMEEAKCSTHREQIISLDGNNKITLPELYSNLELSPNISK
jgi:hypothetical protein